MSESKTIDILDKCDMNDAIQKFNDGCDIGTVSLPMLHSEVTDDIIAKQTPEVQEFIKKNILTSKEAFVLCKILNKIIQLPTLELPEILISCEMHSRLNV